MSLHNNNIHTLRDTETGTKRKRSEEDVRRGIRVPRSTPFQEQARTAFPMAAQASLYGNVIFGPIRPHIEDPTQFRAPANLPTVQDLDFTLFSADIVCNYYTQFTFMQSSKQLLMGTAIQLAIAKGPILNALQIGTATALAYGALSMIYDTFADTVVDALVTSRLPLSYIDAALSLGSYVSGLPKLSGPTVAIAGGILNVVVPMVKNRIKNYVSGRLVRMFPIRSEMHARTDEALLQTEIVQGAILQHRDPAQFELQTRCHNIYALLCQSEKSCGGCQHNDPYKCRNAYLNSLGVKRKVIDDYKKVPANIALAYNQHINDAAAFGRIVKGEFRKWQTCVKQFRGAADEMGLLTSLIFVVVENFDDLKTIVQSELREMLSRIFYDKVLGEQGYKKSVKSLFASTLFTSSESYDEFVGDVVYPESEDANAGDKLRLCEQAWSEIEQATQIADEELRLRKFRTQQIQQQVTETMSDEEMEQEEEEQVIIQQLSPEAERLKNDIIAKFPPSQANPIPSHFKYLFEEMKKKDVTDEFYTEWKASLREAVRHMKLPNVLRTVVSSLTEEIYRFYWVEGGNEEEALRNYNEIKETLLNCRSELGKNWTADVDELAFNRFRTAIQLQERQRQQQQQQQQQQQSAAASTVPIAPSEPLLPRQKRRKTSLEAKKRQERQKRKLKEKRGGYAKDGFIRIF